MAKTIMTLEKYDKKQLSALRPDKLALAVDNTVRGLFQALADAQERLDALTESRQNYKGDDPGVEKCFARDILTEKRNAARAIRAINDYIEEQRELMRCRGLNPDLSYTWAIVPTGEVNQYGNECCRLLKRGVPLELNDLSDDNDRSVRATMKLPSERIDRSRSKSKTKYNDGEYLYSEAVCGIDRSEAIKEY